MFYLMLSLLINEAEARQPTPRQHHQAAQHRHPTAPRQHHQAAQHRHHPTPHQHAPSVGFRFVWNGLIWLELPLSYPDVIWVPGHFGRYSHWVSGHYKTV